MRYPCTKNKIIIDDRIKILQQKTLYIKKVQELKAEILEYEQVIKILNSELTEIDKAKQGNLF